MAYTGYWHPKYWPASYWHPKYWLRRAVAVDAIDQIQLEIDICPAIQARTSVTNGIVTHITATPAIQARIATP